MTVAGGVVYWSEVHAHEDGRSVIVARAPGAAPADVTPPGFDVRSRVHEYGGGAFTVHGGSVFFTNGADQRVYRQDDGEPRPLTPEPHRPFGIRYADGRVTPDGSLPLCVRERLAEPENVNDLVAIPTDGSGEPRVLVGGHDFFAAPRVSPDGRRVAWLSWDHPRMPWEGSELWVADLDDLDGARLVAGGPAEAVVQPEWSADGVLHFCSDRIGWWNLYRCADSGVEPLAPIEAEIGGPLWVFGQSWYAFLDDGRIVCTYTRGGRDHLAVLERPAELRSLELDFVSMVDLTTDGTRALFAAATPALPARVVAVDLASGEVETLSADVPPSQSEVIVDALERNGVPHQYLAFEGEQHGFRRAETIAPAIEAELAFYARVFGL